MTTAALARFRVEVVTRSDKDFFNGGIGAIPAAQHFAFRNSRVIYLARVFYIMYQSDEDEKSHSEVGFDVLFDNWVVKPAIIMDEAK
jgi:hypothetical protein